MICPVSIQRAAQRTTVKNEHLTAERLIELVERGRRCRHYRECLDHIVECATCRAAYKELLAAEQVVQAVRSDRRRWVWWLVPAAAAAVGVIWLLWLLTARSYPAYQVAVRTEGSAVYEGRLRLPDWAASAALQFSTPPPVTRSEQPHAPFVKLLQPQEEGLDNPRPVFVWSPVPESSGYRATLMPASGETVITLQVNGTQATLPAGMQLQPGLTYRLTITVLLPDALPGSEPRQEYTFRMLTAQEVQRLNWARQHRRQAPYTCTVLFYQLGHYQEALATLPPRPNDPLVQRWREVLTHSLPNAVQPAQ
ncbi:hypothetical protein HRbin15_02693 [bacterium HR15]|nr:hypothetical protein HRbin15_02693 [bacterium HR15]